MQPTAMPMAVYPIQAPTGPPVVSAAPDERKRPVPIVPAIAIMDTTRGGRSRRVPWSPSCVVSSCSVRSYRFFSSAATTMAVPFSCVSFSYVSSAIVSGLLVSQRKANGMCTSQTLPLVLITLSG